MQANIVRVNQSFEIWKACQNHPQGDNPSFGSHFALEIKTESTATYYGTRNKLYDFLSKTDNFATCRDIVYILPHMSLRNNKLQKYISVVENALEIV
jgi:hypothetical protein